MKDKVLSLHHPTRQKFISKWRFCGFLSLELICVKIWTGFFILMTNSTGLRQSKLQIESTTSTMEAEIVSLPNCFWELLTVANIIVEVGTAISMGEEIITYMHVCIHHDNACAFTLVKTLLPKFRPCSNHYAVQTHWFQEQIIEQGIKLLRIETPSNLVIFHQVFAPRNLWIFEEEVVWLVAIVALLLYLEDIAVFAQKGVFRYSSLLFEILLNLSMTHNGPYATCWFRC